MYKKLQINIGGADPFKEKRWVEVKKDGNWKIYAYDDSAGCPVETIDLVVLKDHPHECHAFLGHIESGILLTVVVARKTKTDNKLIIIGAQARFGSFPQATGEAKVDIQGMEGTWGAEEM